MYLRARWQKEKNSAIFNGYAACSGMPFMVHKKKMYFT